ncbi:MAG: hypothetical protein QOI13_1121, partial [Paraburkholderia sp.]|nr:hypothetical protein [Paraburkholderia sp.]
MPAASTSHSPAPPPGHAAASTPLHRSPWLAALITAAVVLLVTATAAFVVRKHLLDSAHVRFDAEAARVTADLRREFLVCAQVMRGASGLIAGQLLPPGAAPSADSWDRYVTHLALDDAQPCLRTLGYAQVSGDALTAAPGAPLAHVLLMWPQRGDPADELRLGIRPETRDALLHAADTARVALVVRPASPEEESAASESPTRSRVDAYYPVYRSAPVPPQPAQRRAALAGFIVARIDTEYLFASVAAREPRIDLQVATGTPLNLLYPPGGAPADLPLPTPYLQRSATLRFGGRTFALNYSTIDPALTALADFGGSAFLASGCLAALLAGACAYLFVRRRGQTLVEAGTARWLSTLNEARMMAIVRSSSEAIITIDEAQRIVIF